MRALAHVYTILSVTYRHAKEEKCFTKSTRTAVK